MLCSDEACEIIITLTDAPANAPSTRAAMPRAPIMPPPSTLISAIESTDAMPVIARPPPLGCSEMRLPGWSGRRVFLIRIGIACSTTGTMV